jgi:hypothetical protein
MAAAPKDLAAGLSSNPALVVSRKSDLDDPLLTSVGGACPRRRPIVENEADAS